MAARYAPNPHCVLEPVAQGLNDWRRVTFVPKPGGGGGDDESDEDDDEGALIEATSQLAAAVVPPAWGTIDAGGDRGDGRISKFCRQSRPPTLRVSRERRISS